MGIYFSDRNVYTAPIFNLTPESIPVVAVLHSTHIKNIDALDSSPFKNVYKAMFENLSRYRAIIVSTEQQKIKMLKNVLTVLFQLLIFLSAIVKQLIHQSKH